VRKLSTKTLDVLTDLITGGMPYESTGKLSPYRSGPEILAFFADTLGIHRTYRDGFGSRLAETRAYLDYANGTSSMTAILEAAVHPSHFLDSDRPVKPAVQHLNRFLEFDGFALRPKGHVYRLIDVTISSVKVRLTTAAVQALDRSYLQEQHDKCDEKLSNADYDGAITNARTMVEAIVLAMEESLTGNKPEQDGDLTKYFKRVSKLLNLDPSRSLNGKALPTSLKMILSGLSSVVQGIAETRNKMSDAHARAFKPERRHAVLTVNAARTVADFLVSTYEFQREIGAI
jgi:Abortive infection C-terminus